MARRKNDGPQVTYELKVTLLGTRPPIWRRLLVPAEMTLAQLHDVIQAAMEWRNCHLHEFQIGDKRFGVPDSDDAVMGAPVCLNERRVPMWEVLSTPGAQAVYTYDFGDSWEHSLTVERILTGEGGLSYPQCVDGKRRGPPEDCGGIGGFYHFLRAISNPNHDEHAEMLEWFGGSFDPNVFSIDAVNRRLDQMFRVARKPRHER